VQLKLFPCSHGGLWGVPLQLDTVLASSFTPADLPPLCMRLHGPNSWYGDQPPRNLVTLPTEPSQFSNKKLDYVGWKTEGSVCEFLEGQEFTPALGPNYPSIQRLSRALLGVKRQGREDDPSHRIIAEVRKM
jgi:hypothetical protein